MKNTDELVIASALVQRVAVGTLIGRDQIASTVLTVVDRQSLDIRRQVVIFINAVDQRAIVTRRQALPSTSRYLNFLRQHTDRLFRRLQRNLPSANRR